MEVVRREGAWRLEKQKEGVYVITRQKNPEIKLLTPEYDPDPFNDPFIDTITVQEVGSVQEAEDLFEERANVRTGQGEEGAGGDSDDQSEETSRGNILNSIVRRLRETWGAWK
jgi:hypothetical protein